ncbi:MAG: hypothetical protein F2837_07935 [Actinobacteria bacterium]|nr:hypothetical protein [Actinomycetota bacterium]
MVDRRESERQHKYGSVRRRFLRFFLILRRSRVNLVRFRARVVDRVMGRKCVVDHGEFTFGQ